MTSLDALIRAELGAFLLEVVRISGLVIAAPLAWAVAPARVKVALVLLLGIAVHGQSAVNESLAGSPERIATCVGSEFLLGLSLGMIVRLLVAAVEVAAEQVALMMGLGIAQVFDPQVHGTHNVLAGIYRNFALLIALAVGLHRVMLTAVIGSFRVIPIGSLVPLTAYGPTFVSLGGAVFSSGIRLAMPVVAVLFMTQVALAFISRAAPTMQVFSVGFAVTLGVGALVVTLTLPDLAREIAADMSQAVGRAENVLYDARRAMQ